MMDKKSRSSGYERRLMPWRFESQHCILDGHFSHIFVVKIVMFVWKDENKRKSGRGWPIFCKKSLTLLSGVEQMFREVASEDSLLENSGLLQFAPSGPRQDEAPEEGDQLPVLAQNRFRRLGVWRLRIDLVLVRTRLNCRHRGHRRFAAVPRWRRRRRCRHWRRSRR